MELTHEFSVSIPADEAWQVLTDVVRIAPCLPGAQLQEVDGDEYKGTVKVKVGPVSAEYRGSATFVEQDPAAHRAVLRAQGREARGQGSARADITATLVPDGSITTVQVVTDLTISGRVAQFGRGVLADVSARLLDEFAACLERTVAGGAGGAGESAEPVGSRSSTVPGAEANGSRTGAAGTGTPVGPGSGSEAVAGETPSVDLVRVAGPAVAKRLLPVVIGVLGMTVLWTLWRRSRRRSSRSGTGSTA